MTEKQEFRLLLLSVLSQSMIDNIEDGIGEFKQKHKQIAKSLLNELLKVMDADFGDPEAVSQLVELTVWLEDMFYILTQAGELEEEKQNAFEKDWEMILNKYELKHLRNGHN